MFLKYPVNNTCWKRNSHWEKSKALSNSKYTESFHFSVTLSQRMKRLVWSYLSFTKPYCFSPWTLCSWGCFRIDFWRDIQFVCLFYSMTHWRIHITLHYHFSPFLRTHFKWLLSCTWPALPSFINHLQSLNLCVVVKSYKPVFLSSIFPISSPWGLAFFL